MRMTSKQKFKNKSRDTQINKMRLSLIYKEIIGQQLRPEM